MRRIIVDVSICFDYDENEFSLNEVGEVSDFDIEERVFYDLSNIVNDGDVSQFNLDIRDEEFDD